MAFNFEANPYVKLVETLPELIILPSKGSLSDQDLVRVKQIMASYKRVYFEIGSGSGEHLVERARRDPEGLYIGSEIRFKRIYKTAEKALSINLKNILMIQVSASKLADILPKESFHGLYVLFPDPWSKRKWRKHRILSAPNLKRFYDLLSSDGFIHYKTDAKEYFEETIKLAQSIDLFEPIELSFDLVKSAFENQNVLSEFEKLFRYQDLPIFYSKLQKKRKNP